MSITEPIRNWKNRKENFGRARTIVQLCIFYPSVRPIERSHSWTRLWSIRNDILEWITAGLFGRTQKVVIDGVCSDLAPVLSGVPEGSVLGPILFLIFINELPDNINSTVRLFADGFVLYRNTCIGMSEDQQILQDDLNKLAQWEEAWLMKFNVANCHSMRVTKHPLPKQIIHDYSLNNRVLENVSSAKYLEITVTDDLETGVNI